MIYRFGDFRIDSDGLEITAPDGVVSVQPQVFALLIFLIENRDRVVAKDEIIEGVWGGRIVSDGTLNSRINAARRALGDTGDTQSVIKTFPRRGFRFVAEMADDGSVQTSGSAPGEISQDKPSIAVLPFINMSGDPEQEFFADGITEDLVTSLARLRGFFVIGRNSTFAYKGANADARAVSAELRVRYVLEGSVRTAGDRIRVSAQLTEGESGGQLWADRYDRDLTDIFAIQDELTESVIGRLAPELYAAEHARLRLRTPQSLGAWECFVNALHHYGQQSKEGSARALELLERAIELDPDYAQALGLFSITLSWRVIQRLEPYESTIDKAMDAANRAIAADANDAWAHLGRGMVSMVARDNVEAILSFNRAVDLSPNFAYAHAMFGAANAYAGNPQGAIRSVSHAIRLSPQDTFLDKFHLYYSLAYFQAGDYADAAQAAERAIQLKPEHPNTHMLAASAYALAGEQVRAEAALETFKKLVPGTNASNVQRAIAYKREEDRVRLADGLRQAGLEG